MNPIYRTKFNSGIHTLVSSIRNIRFNPCELIEIRISISFSEILYIILIVFYGIPYRIPSGSGQACVLRNYRTTAAGSRASVRTGFPAASHKEDKRHKEIKQN